MRNDIILLLGTFAICFQSQGQNNGVEYINQLKKDNPLYSGFKGAFSVSDNGAATYDIPFTATPGVGGMTPQISISYNSNNSSSILGEGWSLNGFSIISRAGNNIAIDGYSQPVVFDKTDNLQLDGQRLIPEKDNHGINGATYYTENNSFKRITIANSSGNTINEVQYFKVETKDGLEYYYGNIESSMLGSMGLNTIKEDGGLKGIVATKTQGLENVPFLWLVTLIKDKNNNWIYFKYNLQDNFYSPNEIWYGGNNTTAIGKIVFSYAKPVGGQPNKWNWSSTKFIRGETVLINKPVTQITSYYIEGSNTKIAKEYNLEYELDGTANKLILTKVFQSTVGHLNKDNTSTYKKPVSDKDNAIIFDWYKSTKETTFKNVAVTHEDILLDEDYKIAIADFNGDGFPDKLMHKNYGDKLVYLLSINDKSGVFIPNASLDTIKTIISIKAKSFTGDFNADGINDIVYLSNENKKLCIYAYYSQISSNTEFLNFKEVIKKDISELPDIDFKNINFGIGDLNSDGYSDIIVYYINNKLLNYQSIIFSNDNIIPGSVKTQNSGKIPDKNFATQTTDINGDGITDLLFTWTDDKGWYIRSYIFPNSKGENLIDATESDGEGSLYISPVGLKLPDGISYDQLVQKLESGELTEAGLDSLIDRGTNQTIAEGDYSRLNNIMYADINRDGNVDILISNTDQTGWSYYFAFGKGDGTFSISKKQEISKISFPYNHKSSFGDFNGDGNLDLIIQKTDEKGWHQLTAYGNGKGNFSLSKPDEDFKIIIKNDYSYSQQYITNYVMPYCPTKTMRLNRIFEDSRFKKLIDCDLNSHECFMNNIRQIFAVETGFFPNDIQRPYQSEMRDPMKNFVPQNLNIERNIKRIIGSGYWGDSIINPCQSSGSAGDFNFCFCSGNYKYYTKLTYGDYWQPYVVDLNGDGVSDLLLTYPRQVPNDTVLGMNENKLDKGLFTFSAINKNLKTGFIKEITHSNKNKILIEYQSITNSETNPFPQSELSYPYIACHAPIYTVSKIGTTNGVNNDSINYTKYNYFNAVVSLTGRGFLGFEHTRISNLQNNNQSVHTFWVKDDFLKYGLMPLRIGQTFVDGLRHKISEDNLDYIIQNNSQNNNIYNIFNSKKISYTHDITGVQSSFSNAQFEYDLWGNLTKSNTKRGFGSSEIVQTVINTYYETIEDGWVGENKWLLGRLKESEITTLRGDLSIVRKSAFEYNNETGQLINEISDVGNPLSITKSYKHNRFGNIVESTIFPTYNNIPELTKTTTTKYTKDNRFVESVTDAGGYLTTKKVEPILGLIIETTFANEAKTVIISDEFGREQKSISQEGIESRTELRICKNCEFKDFAAYFSIETNNSSDFKIPVISFYNNNGRIVRKINFDYKLRRIITEYEYDIHGNLIRSSLPYFEGETIVNNTLYTYDKLNRKIKTTLPDQTQINIEYLGLVEKVINEKGQSSTSQRNILGELEQSTDDNGFFINYAYDCYGRVISISDKDSRTYTMEYDLNGNRTSYFNPNFKKPETAVYDVYGRKVKSVNPMGYEKIFKYDKLDRIIEENANRPNWESWFRYTYINQQDKELGKGKLKSIESNSDDHPFNESFTYNSNGQLETHRYIIRSGSWLFERHPSTQSKNILTYEYKYSKGLVTNLTYPSTSITNDKQKLSLSYVYENGTLTKAIGNVSNRQIEFWKLLETNSLGSSTSYKLGENITATQEFDPIVNNLLEIKYANPSDIIAGMKYGYDQLGNLVFRQDLSDSTLYDSLYYDNLNRIIEVKTNNYSTSVKYHDNGDIIQKEYGSNYRFDYSYHTGSNNLNTIKLVNPQNNLTIRTQSVKYDSYGNMVQASFPFLFSSIQTNIVYNQFNLPYSVGNVRFYHAYDGSKIAIYNSSSKTGNTYLGNLSEYYYDLNSTNQLRFQKCNILVNGKVIANFYTNNGQVEYLLKDALNSVIAIADEKGNVDEKNRFSFDVWGLKRNTKTWQYDWSGLRSLANSPTSKTDPRAKGFLNNISLEGFGLVDMSARLYDPFSGRFISVDQITSNSLSNTQFANSYLYGYNNPTVFVDANGKFGFVVVAIAAAYIGASAAGGSLLPWQWNENWWKGALVGVAAVAGGYAVAGPAMFTGGMSASTAVLSGAAAGFAGGFTSTLVNGGNFSQAFENGLKGGIIGGVTAGFTFGIGSGFQNSTGFGSYIGKASLHGLNQGISSQAMGGSFEHGFLAGSFSTLAQPITQIAKTSEQRIVITSMVGGTASTLGGGKFANGALSGAMIQIYNDEQHRSFENSFWKQANRQYSLSEGLEFEVNPILAENDRLDNYRITSTWRTSSHNHNYFGGVDMVGDNKSVFDQIIYTQKLSQNLGIFCQYEAVYYLGNTKFQVDTRYYKGHPMVPAVKVNPQHPASGSHIHCDLKPR